MILIDKRPEPGRLLAYRKQRHAAYDNMPRDVKAEVKRSLVEEQGGLCAYCMSRLPPVDEIDDGDTRVTIEHWSPQRPADGAEADDRLDYRNMLAVCDGNRGSGRSGSMTCDAAKGNRRITVNPLRKETLADIYYTRDGEIHSGNAAVETDLTETLNLNSSEVSLPQKRQRALQTLHRFIQNRYGTRGVTRSALQKLLARYESPQKTKEPYVGILIWWLNDRMRR